MTTGSMMAMVPHEVPVAKRHERGRRHEDDGRGSAPIASPVGEEQATRKLDVPIGLRDGALEIDHASTRMIIAAVMLIIAR